MKPEQAISVNIKRMRASRGLSQTAAAKAALNALSKAPLVWYGKSRQNGILSNQPNSDIRYRLLIMSSFVWDK